MTNTTIRPYLHVLSRHDTASSSHSVANVLAVPVASNAHTGPAGGEAHLPAQRGGGTPSRTTGFISASWIIIFGSPMRDGTSGMLAD